MTECSCTNGWIVEPNSCGQLVAKRCSKCHERRIKEYLGELIEGKVKTWEDWKAEFNFHLQPRIGALRDWASTLGKSMDFPWCASIVNADGTPNYGTGKTHAIIATLFDILRLNNADVRYYSCMRIERLARANDRFFENLENIARFKGLVAIDDLGSETNSEFMRSIIEGIVDDRYSLHLPTLFASNLSVKEIRGRYPRSASRMAEGITIPWSGDDYRRKRGGKNA